MDDWESTDALPEPTLDYHWVTGEMAVGAAIWTRGNMELLRADGITHVVDMQAEFDDTLIAEGTGVTVLWNPCDDDFAEKPPHLFERGLEFSERALGDPRARVYFHCSAGIHRAPMMLLAVLAAGGMELGEAMDLIRGKRPQADFPDVYRRSVVRFLETLKPSPPSEATTPGPKFRFRP